MKIKSDCLSRQQMENLIKNDFSNETVPSLAEHLTSCKGCQKAILDFAGSAEWRSDVEIALHSSDTRSAASLSSDPPKSASIASDGNGADDLLRSSGLLGLLGPTDHPDMLGRIGSYEIVGLIGQGGMGAVFKAFDSGLHPFVAIKILLPHLAVSGAARERFRREGQAAAAVVNDHVLPIYFVDQWRNIPYLVMQYIRGATVQQRLTSDGPLLVHEILRIGLHVAKGLEAAHAQGLVHRDVKPSNILLDGGVGRAIISDFGLARAADDASLTRSGMLAGTPQFMSPEQVRGERLDARSDLFSLGSVLYAMCTGPPPFRADSSYAVMRRITDDQPRPICEINSTIPQWLERLVMSLMEKDRNLRPQTAAEVSNLLQQCAAYLEQPHTLSVPRSLQREQSTLSRFFSWRVLMLASATVFISILSWTAFHFVYHSPAEEHTAAEELGASESASEFEASPEIPRMKGSTTAAGFKITLEGVGELGDISERVTRFQPNLNNAMTTQSSSQFSSDQFSGGRSFGSNASGFSGGASGGSNEGSFGGSTSGFSGGSSNGGFGSTSTGGSSGGFGSISTGSSSGGSAGGGGATFGYSFTKPTYGIALKITDEEAKGKKGLMRYAELGFAVKIVELDGTIEETKDPGPITTTWPKFDRQFPGTSGLYVFRRKGVDEPIKEIHGELKVTRGRRLQAEFPDLKVQRKKVEGEEFSIKGVESNAEGLTVIVSFPQTLAMKNSINMLDRMQAMMQAMNCYDLEIEDKEGNVLIPFGKTSTGAGGGSSQSFGVNGNVQSRSSQYNDPDQPTVAFRFKPVQSHYIQRVTAKVVESDNNPPVTVPFTIQVTTK